MCLFLDPRLFSQRESRFECINYSRFGTFVDDNFYCFGELEQPEDLAEEIPTCSCGVFPLRRREALTGWGETAAQLHHGSLLRFGCLDFVFVLPGNTLPADAREEDDVAADVDVANCYGDDGESPAPSRDGAETDDSDAGDRAAAARFSPRKTRSMIQMRLTSTGN